MTNDMQIRRAASDDIEIAYQIWNRAVTATHAFLTAEDRSAIDAMVRDEFLPAADIWLAVDADDRPLGFLVMDGDMIDALFVDPSAHGRGIGTMLVDHAASLVSSPLRVEASEQATNALPFYLARGFKIVGRTERDHQDRPYPLIHLVRE